MRNVFDTQICEAIHSLYDGALEIAKHDSNLLSGDFESFCDVMWTDDADMNARWLTREEYALALQSAWEHLPH
jgi:hypothetical protein